jgi:hypothetical protein
MDREIIYEEKTHTDEDENQTCDHFYAQLLLSPAHNGFSDYTDRNDHQLGYLVELHCVSLQVHVHGGHRAKRSLYEVI